MIDQRDFMRAYFECRPGESIDSYDAEEDLRRAWLLLTGEKLYDAGRKLRKLRESGFIERSSAPGHVVHYRLAQQQGQDEPD